MICQLITNNFSQDFYLDLVEDNRKITPRDYLEIALRPMQDGGRDLLSRNEVCDTNRTCYLANYLISNGYIYNICATQHFKQIRESIRSLFPDRECFTLVRPLNNENDLRRLDQIPVSSLFYFV